MIASERIGIWRARNFCDGLAGVGTQGSKEPRWIDQILKTMDPKKVAEMKPTQELIVPYKQLGSVLLQDAERIANGGYHHRLLADGLVADNNLSAGILEYSRLDKLVRELTFDRRRQTGELTPSQMAQLDQQLRTATEQRRVLTERLVFCRCEIERLRMQSVSKLYAEVKEVNESWARAVNSQEAEIHKKLKEDSRKNEQYYSKLNVTTVPGYTEAVSKAQGSSSLGGLDLDFDPVGWAKSAGEWISDTYDDVTGWFSEKWGDVKHIMSAAGKVLAAISAVAAGVAAVAACSTGVGCILVAVAICAMTTVPLLTSAYEEVKAVSDKYTTTSSPGSSLKPTTQAQPRQAQVSQPQQQTSPIIELPDAKPWYKSKGAMVGAGVVVGAILLLTV